MFRQSGCRYALPQDQTDGPYLMHKTGNHAARRSLFHMPENMWHRRVSTGCRRQGAGALLTVCRCAGPTGLTVIITSSCGAWLRRSLSVSPKSAAILPVSRSVTSKRSGGSLWQFATTQPVSFDMKACADPKVSIRCRRDGSPACSEPMAWFIFLRASVASVAEKEPWKSWLCQRPLCS